MNDKLISTRGIDGQSFSLKTAILKSQPVDKGLYTFSEFPKFGHDELQKLQNISYSELAKVVLGKFDFGFPKAELDQIINKTYGAQWDTEDVVPITKLRSNEYLLELYHGPTHAFKDVALQFLPRVLSAYRQSGETIRALGVSSGDTISAAHFGVGGVEGLQSYFLLPRHGPSEIQRLQATAHGFKNAMTILIDGSFDDGQKIIKEILTNPKYAEMKDTNNFTSFNSINIARIIAQVVYYFYAYLSLIKEGAIQNGDPLNFSVPSGNFGDTLAGIYAKKMGLPINKINVAANANDVFPIFLQTGKYIPGRKPIQTLAPSQDITVASNFERMIFDIMKDPQRVVALMDSLNTVGYFEVTNQELAEFRETLESSKTTDPEINEAIADIYQQTGKVVDPHTATGIYGGINIFGQKPPIPTVYLATAEHIKFNQPKGVPRDDERYGTVIESLRQNTEDYLISPADEESIVDTIKKALSKVNERV